ncbi:hypothetical protein Tco_0133188 [Tanacetum coccineum]
MTQSVVWKLGIQRAVNVVWARNAESQKLGKEKHPFFQYHARNKMLMCNKMRKEFNLKQKLSNWLAEHDEEIDEQEVGSTLQLHAKD